MSNKNILLCGFQGSGKDQFASYLDGYIRLSFAEPIKNTLQLLNVAGVDYAFKYIKTLSSFIPESFKTELAILKQRQSTDKKNRYALQTIGMGLREYDNYIWINAVKQQIKPENRYVITDCRYLAEFNEFLDWSSVYIEANRNIRIARVEARDGAFDYSCEFREAEQEIELLKPKCKYTIMNNSNLHELRAKALQFVDIIKVAGVSHESQTDN